MNWEISRCAKDCPLTPILKPGKQNTSPDGYRPISNLNTIKKVIEQLMREDIDEFLAEHKIIPEHHHGARANHSTVTAKMVIGEEVNNMRDNQKSIAITATLACGGHTLAITSSTE